MVKDQYVTLEVLGQRLCNNRRHDISQCLRHAIPWTRPQPYANFSVFDEVITSWMGP
jgi:hypothetical protein